jgi:hypothetical protein
MVRFGVFLGELLLFVAQLSSLCLRRSTAPEVTLRSERKMVEEPNARS